MKNEKISPIRLAQGKLANGQYIKNIARDGSVPKRLTVTDPAIAFGQTRQTKPSHAFLHGQALNDEVDDKLHIGKQVPIHPGMKSRSDRGSDGDGFEHLQTAGCLGRNE